MTQKGFRTRADLERKMNAAPQLRAETLGGTSRDFVGAAGAAVHRLLIQTVAIVPRRAWLPIATDRPASEVDGTRI
jgi:hypothetical protein